MSDDRYGGDVLADFRRQRGGLGYTSLEIKVNYLRALNTPSGPLTATGRVTKPGNRVAFADAELTDAEGRLVATASSTLIVFPLQ